MIEVQRLKSLEDMQMIKEGMSRLLDNDNTWTKECMGYLFNEVGNLPQLAEILKEDLLGQSTLRFLKGNAAFFIKWELTQYSLAQEILIAALCQNHKDTMNIRSSQHPLLLLDNNISAEQEILCRFFNTMPKIQLNKLYREKLFDLARTHKPAGDILLNYLNTNIQTIIDEEPATVFQSKKTILDEIFDLSDGILGVELIKQVVEQNSELLLTKLFLVPPANCWGMSSKPIIFEYCGVLLRNGEASQGLLSYFLEKFDGSKLIIKFIPMFVDMLKQQSTVTS